MANSIANTRLYILLLFLCASGLPRPSLTAESPTPESHSVISGGLLRKGSVNPCVCLYSKSHVKVCCFIIFPCVSGDSLFVWFSRIMVLFSSEIFCLLFWPWRPRCHVYFLKFAYVAPCVKGVTSSFIYPLMNWIQENRPPLSQCNPAVLSRQLCLNRLATQSVEGSRNLWVTGRVPVQWRWSLLSLWSATPKALSCFEVESFLECKASVLLQAFDK